MNVHAGTAKPLANLFSIQPYPSPHHRPDVPAPSPKASTTIHASRQNQTKIHTSPRTTPCAQRLATASRSATQTSKPCVCDKCGIKRVVGTSSDNRNKPVMATVRITTTTKNQARTILLLIRTIPWCMGILSSCRIMRHIWRIRIFTRVHIRVTRLV